MSRCIDLTGKRFNKLVVLRRFENAKGGIARWECKCDCGKTTIVRSSNLASGAVKSCGCLIHEKHNTHHLSKHPICRIWYSVRKRCYSRTAKEYVWYGKRGITMCDEWRNDFLSFYKWSLEHGYKDGLSIDRIDNNKGYSPDNCRWTTPKEQANNRRSCIVFTHNGETMNLMQWCKKLNLPYKIVHSRLYKSKWNFERAITEPIISTTKNG